MLKIYEKIKINSNDSMNYIIYYPKDYSDNMPLLLYLHGIGERGNKIEDVEKYALPKYMNKFDIPYIVVAPQCSSNNFWEYHLRDVEMILEELYNKFNYDKDRICILGSSMGAFASWNYIMTRPSLFKGIVSVSGGVMLPINKTLLPIKDKPILIYHGSADDVIDVNESITIYNKLKEMNAKDVELKIVKDDNHYLTSHAFKDNYLYKWLKQNI